MDKTPNISTNGASQEALFRYLLVGQLLRHILSGKSRAQAIRLVAGEAHPSFQGGLRRVSARSLYRWLSSFEEAGMTGLEPGKRMPEQTSRAIPEMLVAFAAQQKELDPCASLPEILNRARQFGLISPEFPVDRSTFYRALKKAGVPVDRRKAQSGLRDSRRFAYPHRMQMLLCDGKHFRAGVSRAKRVALFFLDDATRYGLDVIVGTSENAHQFLTGLEVVVGQYGFFDMLYLDRGPGFIASDTIQVVANLGALLILGEKAYPQGHGKIERFNQTVKQKILRSLDRRPDVDPDCQALTLRLRHWLTKDYNHCPHESLDKQTPWYRFHNDSRALRFPQSRQDLRERFVLYLQRRVSGDHIVSIDAVPYEMPRGYSGAKVTLHRRVLDGTIHFLHQGRLIQLHPADVHANAVTRRGKTSRPEATAPPLPPSAADLHFDRQMKPIVGADGGFDLPEKHKKENPHD